MTTTDKAAADTRFFRVEGILHRHRVDGELVEYAKGGEWIEDADGLGAVVRSGMEITREKAAELFGDVDLDGPAAPRGE